MYMYTHNIQHMFSANMWVKLSGPDRGRISYTSITLFTLPDTSLQPTLPPSTLFPLLTTEKSTPTSVARVLIRKHVYMPTHIAYNMYISCSKGAECTSRYVYMYILYMYSLPMRVNLTAIQESLTYPAPILYTSDFHMYDIHTYCTRIHIHTCIHIHVFTCVRTQYIHVPVHSYIEGWD